MLINVGTQNRVCSFGWHKDRTLKFVCENEEASIPLMIIPNKTRASGPTGSGTSANKDAARET